LFVLCHNFSREHEMSPGARYWHLHWLRVVLWPLPVLTLFKVGRATVSAFG
jgi:hypothetical protein